MIKSLYDQEAFFDQYCDMVGSDREARGEARGVIKLCRKMGLSIAETISNLAENFACSHKEAEEIYYKTINSGGMAAAV